MTETRPKILVAKYFEQSSLKVHREECDCACPDNGFSLTLPIAHIGQKYQQPRLHTQSLPPAHTLLFNPTSETGVAVLNPPALALWNEFRTPRSLSETTQGLTDALGLLDAGLLEPVGNVITPHRGAPRTLSAWLHVTNECNLRCDYCYLSKSNEGMDLETGRAAVDAMLRSALKNQFQQVKLKFAGGEATLNVKLVFELHDYAVVQAAQVGVELDTVILSNGVAIGEKAIAEFESRGLRVMISLDGIGAAHDAQRKFANGGGSFAWVSRTLDRLIAHNIRPFISITLSDRNADGLPDVVGYVLERQLPFNINFFRENDCAQPFADLRLRDDRIIAAMRHAFSVIESNLPDHSLLGSLVDRSQFDQPHDKTCGVGDSYLVIDHKGNVAKCQMEIETPITDVYADDPLALIRVDETGVQNLSVEEKEGCRECEWKYWCAGGCPALTYRATGRYDVKSPNCRIYKAIYPDLLRLEALRLLKLDTLAAAA